jgi:hypothetical protein
VPQFFAAVYYSCAAVATKARIGIGIAGATDVLDLKPTISKELN